MKIINFFGSVIYKRNRRNKPMKEYKITMKMEEDKIVASSNHDEIIGYNTREDILLANRLLNGASVHYAKQHAKKCPQFDNPGTICECDGYHTFGELYEHRIILWIKLCEKIHHETLRKWQPKDIDFKYLENTAWRSKLHHDGTSYDGWFILGIGKKKNTQITYHLPLKFWEATDFAEIVDKAPEFDGHTSDDVLERLKNL